MSQLVPPLAATAGHRWVKLNQKGVRRKYGVYPEQIPDFPRLGVRLIRHIRGLRRVGPQIAANWLDSFPGLEDLIANVDRIHPRRYQTIIGDNVGKLRRNLALTRLTTDLPLPP